MKYNTGTLLMVLSRPVDMGKVPPQDKTEKPIGKTKTPLSKDAKNLNP